MVHLVAVPVVVRFKVLCNFLSLSLKLLFVLVPLLPKSSLLFRMLNLLISHARVVWLVRLTALFACPRRV